MSYYSPPNKGYPQELPERWRFDDGSIRTDLRSLSNAELAALNWIGPIQFLVPRQLDEDGNVIVEGDYNPETHKAVWYKAERKFVVIENHINEGPYDSGEFVNFSPGPADWGTFRTQSVSSPELNSYIASTISIVPLATTSISAILLKIDDSTFTSFEIVWKTITSAVPIPSDLKNNLVSLAKSCNLPSTFIQILEDN